MNKITPEELQTIIDTQKVDIDELNRKLKEAEASKDIWYKISNDKDGKIKELESKLAALKAIVAAI